MQYISAEEENNIKRCEKWTELNCICMSWESRKWRSSLRNLKGRECSNPANRSNPGSHWEKYGIQVQSATKVTLSSFYGLVFVLFLGLILQPSLLRVKTFYQDENSSMHSCHLSKASTRLPPCHSLADRISLLEYFSILPGNLFFSYLTHLLIPCLRSRKILT